MNSTRRYTAEQLGPVEIVDDFLPPPDQLVLKDTGVKITLSVSQKSIDFFKAQAARSRVPYQRMIRSLLDCYASRYGDRRLTTASSARGGNKVPRTRGRARGAHAER